MSHGTGGHDSVNHGTARHDGIIRRGFQGSLAGGVATVVMSGALAFANWSGIMKKQPPRMIRALTMFAAHIVYGGTLGFAAKRMGRGRSRG